MKLFKLFLLLTFVITASVPASAQFRSKMRTANKQYDIHAFNLAVNSYLEALERRPDDAEALGKLADSYRQLNMMEEAARYYAQAIRATNVNKQHLLEFGHVLKALGRYDEAKQWYLTYARDVNAMMGNQYAQSCDFARNQVSANSGFGVTPELINTPSSDFGPVFAGRDQVVFSSARTDLSSAGAFSGKSGNNLLVTTIGEDRFLSVPYVLRNNYSGDGNQGPVAYSPDGATVLFTRNNFVDGTRQIPSSGMQLSLFTATVNNNGEWVDIRPFQFNGANFSTGYASFSPDGRAIYFASDRPEGFGGYDIYVSYQVGNNSWSSPENAGPVINSPGNEITPFYDGVDLYFSSDWHNGLGGQDVFRAQKTDNRWTQIFHMGAAINSPRDDFGYRFDNTRNLGYVVSNRTGGRGNEDIYRVTRSSDNITLFIKNASDGTPVANAIVDFVECGEGSYTSNVQGVYSFQAVQGLACNLVLRKEGFVSTTIPITTTGNGEERTLEVNLTKISETYPGKIVDYNTRIPLQGVVVKLSNRNSGTAMEAVTDVNGDYYVAMSPYMTYDFVVTNPGYQDLGFTLPVEDGLNRNMLGVIGLQPGTSGGLAQGGNTGNMGGGTTTPPVTGGGQVQNGFAIQVGAVSKPSTTQFSNLQELGQVYALEDNGRYKIRVGVYNTRAEAEQALSNTKAKGYGDAFIVQETGGSTANTGTTAPPTTNPPATSTGLYKVQLAAYSKPEYFDRTKAEQLGTIESRVKGALTVMSVGNIATLNEARTIRSRARSLGFSGAFVVVDQNGTWQKVE